MLGSLLVSMLEVCWYVGNLAGKYVEKYVGMFGSLLVSMLGSMLVFW